MPGLVAIVGRPNVGKSTLFNRLVGARSAIVHEQSGVTRDRIYGHSDWNGVEFSVVDTGGIVQSASDPFQQAITTQANVAINDADIILFMLDVTTGITDLDDALARQLRMASKPVIPVINKVDDYGRINDSYVFHGLGLGDPFPLSAINGSGTGELLDRIVELLPSTEDKAEESLPRLSIVGRPNAGKSSIVNALLGEERHIVSPVAGTTRDPVNSTFDKFGFRFEMVDTAGIRKKNKVEDPLEFYSVIRAIRAIENADVSILVVDATRGFEGQDQTIFHRIIENRKGVLIAVNKWDLVEKDHRTIESFTEDIRRKIAPMDDVPIIFTSALTKQRLLKLIEAAVEVYKHRSQRIPTAKLNQALLPAIEEVPPPAYKGKYIRIKYVTQLPTPWPSFAFFCNLPQYVRDPYKRYLENQIRANFPFAGVPIQVFMRKK